jgi:hypothetical protein
MLSLTQARRAVEDWNSRHEHAWVAFETVEECIFSLARWQRGIREFWPLEDLSRHLDRHWDMCRRLPDELLMELFQVEEMLP